MNQSSDEIMPMSLPDTKVSGAVFANQLKGGRTHLNHIPREKNPDARKDPVEMRHTLEGLLLSAIDKEVRLDPALKNRETLINRLHMTMGDPKALIDTWLARGFPDEAFKKLLEDGLPKLSGDEERILSRVNTQLIAAVGSEKTAGRG